MTKHKHLDLKAKTVIRAESNKGTPFKEIGLFLGKNCTTISKEIRKHISRENQALWVGHGCLLNIKRECSTRHCLSQCISLHGRLC